METKQTAEVNQTEKTLLKNNSEGKQSVQHVEEGAELLQGRGGGLIPGGGGPETSKVT